MKLVLSSLLLFALSLCCSTFAADATLNDETPSVLELSNGNFVRGRLSKIENGELVWQSDHFTEPFRFALSAVNGLKFAPRETKKEIANEFLVELANRDTFYADLIAIGDDYVEVESSHLGKVKLQQSAIRRLSRNGENIKAYPVPSRLDDWVASDQGHWRSEGNSFVTEQKMASLYADVELPDKAMIELEIAWDKDPKSGAKPSFSVYLGCPAATPLSRKHAFSVEVWEDFAVIQRQTKSDADLASLAEVGVGSLHIFAYLDQTQDQIIIYSASGKLLANLKVGSNVLRGSSLMFVNRSGQFRLKYVQVRGWSGEKPNGNVEGAISIAVDNENIGAEKISLADGTVSWSDKEGTNSKLSLDQVKQIDFPIFQDATVKSDFVAGFLDGSRVSGKLLSSDAKELLVEIAASSAPITVALNQLRGFAIAGEVEKATPVAPDTKRLGKLELMDTRLHGWLVPNDKAGQESKKEATCLLWQPAAGLNASPIKSSAFGRIVYVEPIKKKAPVRNNTAQQARMRGVIRAQVMINGRRVATKPKTKNVVPNKSARSVHLRTGDIIPCTVERIDESGVHISSTMTETKFLAHDQVKAAQLITNAPLPLLSKEKRERLLTLPRIQRNSPPKHLLFSEEGDVLRGSVVALGKDDLELEIRMEPRTIPKHRISTIVWLHEDEWNEKAKDERPENAEEDGLLVQVVRNSGSRYSFIAQSFGTETIHGHSSILKAMHVNVDEIDQLLLGGFIKKSAQSLVFGRWHLSSAQDPKFVTAGDEASGETAPGTESLLVGKIAPDLKLKMLDEKTNFLLREHRGHCVVLDFWATWCGPCLQVMPVVEEVVGEFEDKDVKLFAVNLEERPEQIKATLERRKIDVPVVLDRDGVAAARYEATAIPQTVIIGPDGMVERVFIGSSRKFADNLRSALSDLTK